MAEILILDDVLDAAVLVGKILTKAGHIVHTFTEGEQALRCLQKQTIDLAILDIKLKTMSGIEVLAELKRLSPATRVIMLTGFPTMETTRQASDLGADEYCLKPIDRRELEETVAQVLARAAAIDGPDPGSAKKKSL